VLTKPNIPLSQFVAPANRSRYAQRPALLTGAAARGNPAQRPSSRTTMSTITGPKKKA